MNNDELEAKIKEAVIFWNERKFQPMILEFLSVYDSYDNFRTENGVSKEEKQNFLTLDLIYTLSRISDMYGEDFVNFGQKFPKLWQEMKSGSS